MISLCLFMSFFNGLIRPHFSGLNIITISNVDEKNQNTNVLCTEHSNFQSFRELNHWNPALYLSMSSNQFTSTMDCRVSCLSSPRVSSFRSKPLYFIFRDAPSCYLHTIQTIFYLTAHFSWKASLNGKLKMKIANL